MGLMKSALEKTDVKGLPVQAEWHQKATCVRDWWRDRVGTYGETEAGVEDITFTELNERRAASRVEHFEYLMSLAHRGALTEDDTEEIQRAYRRLPSAWKI